MKLAIQLAYKNLIGAGLRTWLNVIVLSFAFIIIIFFNAMLQGWNNQAKEDGIAWDYGYGHILNNNYDPYDAFSIQDGHDVIPQNLKNTTPILIQQGSIYPEGRMVSVLIKGIQPNQNSLKIPTEKFKNETATIPAMYVPISFCLLKMDSTWVSKIASKAMANSNKYKIAVLYFFILTMSSRF